MASDKGLEHSIKSAVRHYSSLFALPSYRRILLATFLLCITGGALIVLPLDFSFLGLAVAFQFSALFFALSTFADLTVRQVFMKSDPVYNKKRCAALSMFSNLLWFGFLLVGSTLVFLTKTENYSFDLLSIGFAAVSILRLIVLHSTSFTSYWRRVASAFTQPILCLPPMFNLYYQWNHASASHSIVFLFVSIPVSILTASTFISSVDNVGYGTFGVPTTSVLKVFLANWMENLNGPIEKLFDSFGKEKTIAFSLLAFGHKNSVDSVTVISSFHPGPFRNVGSSLLPFIIQKELEKKLSCVVSVPHGLFGHEFDLSSQLQNQKVLNGILASANFKHFDSKATRFVASQKDVAHASCQVFGSCALLTLTLAPETTEDFPQEIGDFVVEQAKKLGLTHVALINAHNSINNPFDVKKALEPLKEAALDALTKATRLKPSSFEAGAAKIVPQEFSVEDGMGPGGICVSAVRVNGQTSAYVTLDGNNMVSGVRAKILDALKDLGVDAGEVLTTDTHAVNGVVRNARGYHPLGEAMPLEKLIKYVESAASKALNNMKSNTVSWLTGQVPRVMVIGERQIREMVLLADKALKRAKKTAVPLFTAAGLLLIALLVFL